MAEAHHCAEVRVGSQWWGGAHDDPDAGRRHSWAGCWSRTSAMLRAHIGDRALNGRRVLTTTTKFALAVLRIDSIAGND